MGEKANVLDIGREFVRQYYTLLHSEPSHMHRFYLENSTYVHGCRELDAEMKIGKQEIHRRIVGLKFKDVHTRILVVDTQETTGDGILIQVYGELSSDGEQMRKFVQSFVLAPVNKVKVKHFYVRNDIFRFLDEKETNNTEPIPSPELETIFETDQSEAGTQTDRNEASVVTQTEKLVEVFVATKGWDEQDTSTDDFAINGLSFESDEVTDIPTDSGDFHLDGPTLIESWAAANFIPEEVSTPIQPPAPPVQPTQRRWETNNENKTYEKRSTTAYWPSHKSDVKYREQPITNKQEGNQRPDSFVAVRPKTRKAYSSPLKGRGDQSDATFRPRSTHVFPDNNQIFVGFLPQEAEEQDVTNVFQQYGNVIHVRIIRNPKISRQDDINATNLSKVPNYCFVVFDNDQSVKDVMDSKPIFMQLGDKNVKLNVEKKRPANPQTNSNRGFQSDASTTSSGYQQKQRANREPFNKRVTGCTDTW